MGMGSCSRTHYRSYCGTVEEDGAVDAGGAGGLRDSMQLHQEKIHQPSAHVSVRGFMGSHGWDGGCTKKVETTGCSACCVCACCTLFLIRPLDAGIRHGLG